MLVPSLVPENPLLRKTSAALPAIGLALFTSLSSGTAFSQELLEENFERLRDHFRSNDTYLPDLKFGDDTRYIKISGVINKGVLVHDDGRQALDYWFVDNSNYSTRGRVKGYAELRDGMATGIFVEAEWTPYATVNINQTNRGTYDWGTALLRHTDFWIGDDHETNRYGMLSIGQGFMASDTITAIDFSKTWAAAHVGAGDTAGGQLFRAQGTGALSGVMVSDAFGQLDGLGRLLRVRYRTPRVAGFRFSTSYGTKVVPSASGQPGWDAALRYSYDGNAAEFGAGIAYSRAGDGTESIAGSGSMLLPSGLNFTVAGANTMSGPLGSRYIYGKVGYIARLVPAGITAFSVDGYLGSNFNTAESSSRSYGFQVTQTIDYWKTQFYLGIRRFEFSEVGTRYEDGTSVLFGGKVLF